MSPPHLFIPSSGYTATPANLLTVPVYTLACIVTCAVGVIADRYGQRGFINMYVSLLYDCGVRSLTVSPQDLLLHRPRGVHHPDLLTQRGALVLRCVPRRLRDLPEHPEHDSVGVEQCRGQLQAQRHARDGD